MLAAAVVDLGMMLLSAILSAGVPSVLGLMVITGAVLVLAVATVNVIAGGVQGRIVGPFTRDGGELTTLAARLAAGRVRSRQVGRARNARSGGRALREDRGLPGQRWAPVGDPVMQTDRGTLAPIGKGR